MRKNKWEGSQSGRTKFATELIKTKNPKFKLNGNNQSKLMSIKHLLEIKKINQSQSPDFAKKDQSRH